MDQLHLGNFRKDNGILKRGPKKWSYRPCSGVELSPWRPGGPLTIDNGFETGKAAGAIYLSKWG